MANKETNFIKQFTNRTEDCLNAKTQEHVSLNVDSTDRDNARDL